MSNPQTGTSPFKWFATKFFLPGYNQAVGSVVLASDVETAQQIVNTFVGKYRRERVKGEIAEYNEIFIGTN